jgi:iron complex outermembrane receptor protein
VPGFLELFGNQGATQGNPALVPERAESWDAGLAWSSNAVRGPSGFGGALEYAHHESRARDLIVFVRNSPNSSKATNLSRARIRGDELSARCAAPFGITGLASFTWQSARDRGDVPFWYGKRLPQRPARQWYARLGWARSPLSVASDVLFVGENFLDRYNRQPVRSRTLVGASASVALFHERLRLVVEGKNLGDARASDIGGYPLPGRSLYVSCQAHAGSHTP